MTVMMAMAAVSAETVVTPLVKPIKSRCFTYYFVEWYTFTNFSPMLRRETISGAAETAEAAKAIVITMPSTTITTMESSSSSATTTHKLIILSLSDTLPNYVQINVCDWYRCLVQSKSANIPETIVYFLAFFDVHEPIFMRGY
ncbi:hypothetical protein [Brevibacillus laterosporus]|uniref:hypothetical protein n=1 Tax=Brevibacillus laterosporus TaxID=1465 RepID=UPI0013156693|nr:hypothetical protein [Brevibacillus laterosporus]